MQAELSMFTRGPARRQGLFPIVVVGDGWWQALSRPMMGLLLLLISVPFIAHAGYGLFRPGWLSRGWWVNHNVLAALLGGRGRFPTAGLWFELVGALILFVAGLMLIVLS